MNLHEQTEHSDVTASIKPPECTSKTIGRKERRTGKRTARFCASKRNNVLGPVGGAVKQQQGDHFHSSYVCRSKVNNNNKYI